MVFSKLQRPEMSPYSVPNATILGADGRKYVSKDKKPGEFKWYIVVESDHTVYKPQKSSVSKQFKLMPTSVRTTKNKSHKQQFTSRALEQIFVEYNIISTVVDGNCGVDVISKAIQSRDTRVSPLSFDLIRRLLASSVKPENFEYLRRNYVSAIPRTHVLRDNYASVETVEGLQNILMKRQHYLTTQDVEYLCLKLGGYMAVIVNEAYNPKSNNVFEKHMILTSPLHCYTLLTTMNNNPNVIVFYNQNVDTNHYQLIQRKNSTLAVQEFRNLPKKVRDVVHNLFSSYLESMSENKSDTTN